MERPRIFYKELEAYITKNSLDDFMSLGYELIRCVGQGGYGAVWLANYNHRDVAVKFQNILKLPEKLHDVYVREVKILKTLRHENLVELYDVYAFGNTIIYSMEYSPDGDLWRLLTHNRLSEPQSARFYKQIGAGLKHFHDNGFAHCDLKPANILMTRNCQVCKLTDYSLSKCCYNPHTGLIEERVKHCRTTAKYSPPEIRCSQTARFPQKIDIWSLGVTLYNLLNGTYYPFICEKEQSEECMKKLDQIPWYNTNVSRDARRFVLRHFEFMPENRPEVRDLLNDRWLDASHRYVPEESHEKDNPPIPNVSNNQNI